MEEQASKLKLTCENCVRAKVKCTGHPGPCERCAGWRKLDCIFLEERKRGRPRLPEDASLPPTAKCAKPARQVNEIDDTSEGRRARRSPASSASGSVHSAGSSRK